MKGLQYSIYTVTLFSAQCLTFYNFICAFIYLYDSSYTGKIIKLHLIINLFNFNFWEKDKRCEIYTVLENLVYVVIVLMDL